MQPIRHIVAATDLSSASLRVVERGFRLAQQTGAHYTVVHALGLDALGPLRNLLGSKASDVTQTVLNHKRQELEAIVRDPRYHHGIHAQVLLEEGLATSVVPAYATAPALFFVACLMLRDLTELDWDDTTEVIPAAVTALVMPFTYSIANGLAFGFITYAVLKLFTGKAKEVHKMVWAIGSLFLFKFVYIGGH